MGEIMTNCGRGSGWGQAKKGVGSIARAGAIRTLEARVGLFWWLSKKCFCFAKTPVGRWPPFSCPGGEPYPSSLISHASR